MPCARMTIPKPRKFTRDFKQASRYLHLLVWPLKLVADLVGAAGLQQKFQQGSNELPSTKWDDAKIFDLLKKNFQVDSITEAKQYISNAKAFYMQKG